VVLSSIPIRMWAPRVDGRAKNHPTGHIRGAGRAAARSPGPTAETTSPSAGPAPDETVLRQGDGGTTVWEKTFDDGGAYGDPRGCVPDLEDLVRSSGRREPAHRG